MSDILDSIDDILGDDGGDGAALTSVEFIEVDDTMVDASRDLDELIENESTMSENEAREITEAIRSAATATYILLAQAHEGKAYRALGYATWANYVRDEFEISPARSYQLLDLSKAVAMIEEVAPEGTSVKLTEAQARDIKRELPRITEQIQDETRDLGPEDASDAIGRIIEDHREQQKADDKVLAEKERALEEAKQDGYHAGLEAAADALLESDMPDTMTASADDEFIEVEVSGEGGMSPTDSMNIYNFVNSLVGLNALPEPDDFVETIPQSRVNDMLEQTNEAISWLNRLSTLLELRED